MAGEYELNLRDYWRILRRRKYIVIFTTVMVTVFSFLILFAQSKKEVAKFRATAKIQIEKKSNLSDAYLQTFMYGGDDLLSRQMVITSNAVMERVAKKLGRLERDPSPDYRGYILPDTVTSDQVARTPEYIQVLDRLKGQTSTDVEEYTNIVTISVTDVDKNRAADVANAVAEAYKEYNFDEMNKQSEEAFTYVKSQRDSVRQELSKATEELKDYRIKNRLTTIDVQIAEALRMSTEKEKKLLQTSEHLKELDTMLSELEDTGTLTDKTMESLIFEATSGTISSFSDQLTTLNQQREVLLRTYTESYPAVKALDEKIAAMQSKLGSQLRARRNGLRRQKELTTAELDTLQSMYESLPEKGMKLGGLEYEVETRRMLFVMLEEEYQKASIKQRYEEKQEVSIIQRAFPGRRINPPSSMAKSLVGTVIGVMLGLVFAFVMETLDTSVGTIEDVQEYVGVSVLGLIPQTSHDDIRDALEERGIEWDEKTLDRSIRLITYFDPQSSLAESYRQLRTNIQFVALEKGINTIAVTSSSMQEGKSTTTCNLALTMAQLGKRVLLVDCDLRKPSLARTFGVDREPGLTDIILGNYEPEEVMKTVHDIMVAGIGLDDAMMTTWIENLNLLTSGTIPPNAAELLGSTRMGELIEKFREEYDIVVFDTPPVLEATDARILSRKVGGTLLVYKVGEVARSRLKRMKLLLDGINAPILGVVLNGLKADISSDFQDMRYYSYYSYGHEKDTVEPWWRRLADRGIRTVKTLTGRGEEELEEEELEEEELEDVDEEMELEERSRMGDRLSGLGALFGKCRKLVLGISTVFVGAGLLWQMEVIPPGGSRGTPRIPASRERAGAGSLGHPASSETMEMKATEGSGAGGTAPPDAASDVAVLASSAAQEISPKEPPEDRARMKPAATESVGPLREETRKDPDRAEPSEVVPRAESAGSSTGPFSVHVNSHASWRAAEEEVARLLRAGYRAFAVPAHRDRVRVLVGSFGTKAEAAKRADRLRREGYADLTVVLRLPYAVRMPASFDFLDAAERERQRLSGEGYFPYILTHTSRENGSEYVVALGAFSSEKEARHFSYRLNEGELSCQVIAR